MNPRAVSANRCSTERALGLNNGRGSLDTRTDLPNGIDWMPASSQKPSERISRILEDRDRQKYGSSKAPTLTQAPSEPKRILGQRSGKVFSTQGLENAESAAGEISAARYAPVTQAPRAGPQRANGLAGSTQGEVPDKHDGQKKGAKRMHGFENIRQLAQYCFKDIFTTVFASLVSIEACYSNYRDKYNMCFRLLETNRILLAQYPALLDRTEFIVSKIASILQYLWINGEFAPGNKLAKTMCDWEPHQYCSFVGAQNNMQELLRPGPLSCIVNHADKMYYMLVHGRIAAEAPHRGDARCEQTSVHADSIEGNTQDAIQAIEPEIKTTTTTPITAHHGPLSVSESEGQDLYLLPDDSSTLIVYTGAELEMEIEPVYSFLQQRQHAPQPRDPYERASNVGLFLLDEQRSAGLLAKVDTVVEIRSEQTEINTQPSRRVSVVSITDVDSRTLSPSKEDADLKGFVLSGYSLFRKYCSLKNLRDFARINYGDIIARDARISLYKAPVQKASLLALLHNRAPASGSVFLQFLGEHIETFRGDDGPLWASQCESFGEVKHEADNTQRPQVRGPHSGSPTQRISMEQAFVLIQADIRIGTNCVVSRNSLLRFIDAYSNTEPMDAFLRYVGASSLDALVGTIRGFFKSAFVPCRVAATRRLDFNISLPQEDFLLGFHIIEVQSLVTERHIMLPFQPTGLSDTGSFLLPSTPSAEVLALHTTVPLGSIVRVPIASLGKSGKLALSLEVASVVGFDSEKTMLTIAILDIVNEKTDRVLPSTSVIPMPKQGETMATSDDFFTVNYWDVIPCTDSTFSVFLPRRPITRCVADGARQHMTDLQYLNRLRRTKFFKHLTPEQVNTYGKAFQLEQFETFTGMLSKIRLPSEGCHQKPEDFVVEETGILLLAAILCHPSVTCLLDSDCTSSLYDLRLNARCFASAKYCVDQVRKIIFSFNKQYSHGLSERALAAATLSEYFSDLLIIYGTGE